MARRSPRNGGFDLRCHDGAIRRAAEVPRVEDANGDPGRYGLGRDATRRSNCAVDLWGIPGSRDDRFLPGNTPRFRRELSIPFSLLHPFPLGNCGRSTSTPFSARVRQARALGHGLDSNG